MKRVVYNFVKNPVMFYKDPNCRSKLQGNYFNQIKKFWGDSHGCLVHFPCNGTMGSRDLWVFSLPIKPSAKNSIRHFCFSEKFIWALRDF